MVPGSDRLVAKKTRSPARSSPMLTCGPAFQWNAGPHVSMGELRAGDLVFFATSLSDPGTIHHVGMYIGRGLMVEAPFTGANVRVSSIGRADYIGTTRPTG